ncbi:hypothetical protein SLA2020_476730 [Shorea laevis]
MVVSVNAAEKTRSEAFNLMKNSVVFSSAFSQTPFAPPFLRRLKRNSVPVVPQTVIRDLHNSIVSAADEFVRGLHSFASQNPVFKKVLRLSSEFQSFCNEIVTCRNEYRKKVNFSFSKHNFAAVLPGDSMAGLVVANGILNFLNIYNTLLIVRLILTWFPNSPPVIVNPLSTLCDPYLNLFRGIIPPVAGTLDLSPILAFLVLDAFTNTAAALPAELPLPGQSPTTSQEKWMRRLLGSRSTSSKSNDAD